MKVNVQFAIGKQLRLTAEEMLELLEYRKQGIESPRAESPEDSLTGNRNTYLYNVHKGLVARGGFTQEEIHRILAIANTRLPHKLPDEELQSIEEGTADIGTSSNKPEDTQKESIYLKELNDAMPDCDVPAFFEHATNRKYSSQHETCVNDIRRLLIVFWNDRLKRHIKEGTLATVTFSY